MEMEMDKLVPEAGDLTGFIEQFEVFASAPGGIESLRELILKLAVQGKLVHQNYNNNALDELKGIKSYRNELFNSKSKKKIKFYENSSINDVHIPKNWVAECIGNLIISITGGGTPSKRQPEYWGGDIPWASVKDLKDLKYLNETQDFITEDGVKNSSTNLIEPGYFIVCTRMGLGKAVINRITTAINQDLKAIELPEEINIDYFHIFYKTLEIIGAGVTVSGIKQDDLLAIILLLPPLEEQKRIVAKVDELMSLCDKLEAQQQQQAHNVLRANTAAIHALLNPEPPQTEKTQKTAATVSDCEAQTQFEQNWQRIAQHFNTGAIKSTVNFSKH